MRLGNDIVDLTLTAEHNPRFMDRILSPEEQHYFTGLTLDSPLLWMIWACKESAYKAIKQTQDIAFHHQSFILAADLQSIRHHDQTLEVKVRQQNDMIFALATDGPWQQIQSRSYAFEREAKPEEQSRKARELLLEMAGECLHLPQAELSIAQDQRIPHLVHQGQRLQHAISLSHHGRFLAASLAI